MLAVNPSQWDIWRNEITGMDAPGRADPGVHLPAPDGDGFPAVAPFRRDREREGHPRPGGPGGNRPTRRPPLCAEQLAFTLCLFVTPLLLMSFFKDKTDRYLLPLAGPQAVLTAWGLARRRGGCAAAGRGAWSPSDCTGGSSRFWRSPCPSPGRPRPRGCGRRPDSRGTTRDWPPGRLWRWRGSSSRRRGSVLAGQGRRRHRPHHSYHRGDAPRPVRVGRVSGRRPTHSHPIAEEIRTRFPARWCTASIPTKASGWTRPCPSTSTGRCVQPPRENLQRGADRVRLMELAIFARQLDQRAR